MNLEGIKSSLPPYKGERILVKNRQTVRDIMGEILEAHQDFSRDYDRIYSYFDCESLEDLCRNLVRFCKSKIRYKMEGEEKQTVKSPSAIIHQGYGDCKHYASFCGGILDAIKRNTGRNIDWRYRFASYDVFNPEPGHVFVIVKNKGSEIWIDPTPGAERSKQTYQLDKKPKEMALYKISGIDQEGASTLLDTYVDDSTIYFAIQTLILYGVMDVSGKVHPDKLIALQKRLPEQTFLTIVQAYQTVRAASIGGLFSTLWRGVKKVTLAVPRAAYLSLVNINAFGYASKLYNAVYNKDGSYTSFKAKLKTLWQDRLGGDWTKLENTIRIGYKKKAILGAAPAIPAWVATASAVIAAVMPLVNAFLKQQQQQTGIDYNTDPTTGMPYSDGNNHSSGYAPGFTEDPLQWIKDHPIPSAGIAFIAYKLITKKRMI